MFYCCFRSSLHSFFVGSAAVALIDASTRSISLWETAFGTMLVSQTLEQLSIAQSQPAAAVEELVAAGRGKKRARAAPAATATALTLTLQCVVVPSQSDSTSTAAASVLLIAPDAVHLLKATAPAAPTLASALGRLSTVASLLMPQSDADSSAVASLAHAAPSVTVPVSFDVSSLRGPTGALALVPPAEMAIDSMWGSTAPQANAANVEEQNALRKLSDSQLSDSDWCSAFEDFVSPSDAKRSKKSAVHFRSLLNDLSKSDFSMHFVLFSADQDCQHCLDTNSVLDICQYLDDCADATPESDRRRFDVWSSDHFVALGKCQPASGC
jgi:hypothetical protein